MTDAQGTPLDAGDIVGERFQLIRRLGKGGMGTVWRARHLTLESDVALKLVDPTIARTSEGRARFKREAQAAAAIRSPHVVQILDHGVHDEIPFIVMELLEGESLAQRLDRGALSLAETTRVLVQVGRAVSRAHAAGVVHRDLKPDNIFLIRNDDEEIAKVLDFGIAKARFQHTTEDTTRTGAVLGTPHYMSPEQLRGDKALDYRADIWALGVIAYECVTQAKPFVSETFADLVIKICSEDAPPPSSRASVPESFDAWFFRATNRNPELRFASVREQIQALRGIVDPDFDPARGAPEPPQLEDAEAELAAIAVSDVALNTQHGTANTRPVEPVPSRTRRAWVVALAVLVLVVAGAAVATLGTTPRAEPVAADTPDAAALAEPSSTAPRELSAMVPHSPSAAALGSVERPGDAARAKSEQPVALDASAGAVQPASPPGPRPV
ncbi:MAG: protein kinase, partial [Myxococcales bacterium]|nr:protein kinase [Myxococcales bacterium]